MDNEELLLDLGGFAYDPLGFVMWAFPWGVAGTELAKETGPDEWQLWVLEQVRDGLLTLDEAVQIAVTSGHGIGKSALVAWLLWWAYSTFPGTRGVVTANTENQLKTKTWVEIAKWYRLFIAKELFKVTATAIFPQDESLKKEWRIDVVPWSEHNTEAFAGMHNAGKRIIIIFDEASAIPDLIHETTEGALTDENTEILWFMFGNPTKTKGRFREAFEGGRFAHRWRSLEVDSRTVKRTNKKQLNSWVEDYGIESDFVRVRVLGKFPKTDATSFIDPAVAVEATKRQVVTSDLTPVVLGVDVARFGDDISVIWPRQGRDGSKHPVRFFQKLSTTQLAAQVQRYYVELSAVAVFIDGTGVGGGVVDSCRALGLRVYEVQFSGAADNLTQGIRYMNKRAEIWGLMRDWLATGSIPHIIGGRNMVEELAAPTYTIAGRQDSIQLESKEMMKRRGILSPDFADALACTFAMPMLEFSQAPGQQKFVTDYNPLSDERLRA